MSVIKLTVTREVAPPGVFESLLREMYGSLWAEIEKVAATFTLDKATSDQLDELAKVYGSRRNSDISFTVEVV